MTEVIFPLSFLWHPPTPARRVQTPATPGHRLGSKKGVRGGRTRAPRPPPPPAGGCAERPRSSRLRRVALRTKSRLVSPPFPPPPGPPAAPSPSRFPKGKLAVSEPFKSQPGPRIQRIRGRCAAAARMPGQPRRRGWGGI